MKKIFIALLLALTVFSFVSCDTKSEQELAYSFIDEYKTLYPFISFATCNYDATPYDYATDGKGYQNSFKKLFLKDSKNLYGLTVPSDADLFADLDYTTIAADTFGTITFTDLTEKKADPESYSAEFKNFNHAIKLTYKDVAGTPDQVKKYNVTFDGTIIVEKSSIVKKSRDNSWTITVKDAKLNGVEYPEITFTSTEYSDNAVVISDVYYDGLKVNADLVSPYINTRFYDN